MPHQSSLGLLRLHQRDAHIDARERFATHVASRVGSDLLVLSTCHRVECYVAIPPAVDELAWMRDRVLGPDGDPVPAVEETGEAAVRHLFRAAMGLDSVVRGEGQILGQLRDTYDGARGRFALDPLLSEVIQHALHIARDVRSSTSLGQVQSSVGSLAVDTVVARLPDPSTATVLVIGAGEIGKLAARALVSRVGTVRIANRDAARAHELAAAIGATAQGLDDLERAIGEADAVISAADTRGTLLTEELLARRLARGPLVLVDVAVPRSISEPARALPGLTYRSVDELKSGGGGARDHDVVLAEQRCIDEAQRFVRLREGRAAAPTIEALRKRADAIRQRQLDRAFSKLTHLDPRDRSVVEALADALTGALIHEPIVSLREDPTRQDAARALFGLERS
ncbi:MAG TPA: glutamyl-tRNA reductase [Chloroflexi bacterium]|nr:glutamyl-tRNA reductase [Chloroflexota bacterium]HAL26390.1 glutamyl-tRNA reductase [Chloroflexota bacterium]